MTAEAGKQAVSAGNAPSCGFNGSAARAALKASTPANTDLSSFIGRSVGTGQCVALVKAANPSLGPSSGWVPGVAVRGNTTLAPGTPIATFDGSNKYANATNGTSHAAIYLGQDQRGMLVMDQWAGSGAKVRMIPWSNPGSTPANTGSAFRVVQTPGTTPGALPAATPGTMLADMPATSTTA